MADDLSGLIKKNPTLLIKSLYSLLEVSLSSLMFRFYSSISIILGPALPSSYWLDRKQKYLHYPQR